MKNRILTGWTFNRALFLLMGSLAIVQSALDRQWLGILFGAYFAMMGLFSIGCAAGNCSVRNYPTKAKQEDPIEETTFQEIN